MSRILVAGGTGHLGREVVAELKKRRCWVRVLTRRPEQIDLDVDDIARGNLLDPPSLHRACEGIECIFSAAGASVDLEGAAYLRAATNDDGLLFHHEPDGEDLFYLSWCHGPPGTARLYYRLWQLTEDDAWMEAVHEAARAVMHTGIPDTLTAGFWNNVGQCCGSAGVAEFFHALYRITEQPDYRDFAEHVSDNLLRRAAEIDGGLAWVQAEHRVQPDNLAAQTGLMQGAAGIGLWLLHLSSGDRDAATRIALPDSPW